MQHISEIIENILVEWAYRVHDGMPNPKNAQHIQELRESMEELNLPNNVIYHVIHNIINEQDDDEEKVTFKHDGETRTITMKTARQYASDIKQGKGNDEKEAAVKAANLDDEDTEKPEPETQPGMKISKDGNLTKKGDDKKEIKPKTSNEDLRDEDHETTDSQMNLSKADAKAQAEKKGEKGVGAGTAESRAGEAAVHYTLRELLKGRDIEDIKSELMKIAKDKDKILNEKWVNAATNTASWIKEVYGDNIEEVVWDTPSGRKLIGVEGHGTSSDMFIRTKDGKNIGISLKQTTAVFLLNGGYAKQHDILVESLSETLSEEEIEEFKTQTSIQTYQTGFRGQLSNIKNTIESDKNLQNLLKERIEYFKTLDDDEFKKIFDSTKYRKNIDNLDKIITKLPHISTEEAKFIAKLTKDSEIRQKYTDLYDNLRGEEIKLTQSILNSANNNENVAKGLKKLCLDGMHIEDILFGKSEALDEFITLYGNNPAVELDKGVLLQIFGMQDEYEQYLSLGDEEEKEEFKKQLLEKMNDKIIIDIKDGARSGEIKIKHEDGEFHLFGIKARTKPIGTSPGLELNQTSFMGNVIKEGTPDITKWSPAVKSRFVNNKVKEIEEEMEDANTEQKKALQEEINKLKSIL